MDLPKIISTISVLVLFAFNIGCENVEFEELTVNSLVGTDAELCAIGENPICSDLTNPPTSEDSPQTPPSTPPSTTTISWALDTFTQNTGVTGANKVDLLIVQDTSLSMRTDTSLMAKKLSKMGQHLSGMDWQMGITTTSLDGAQTLNGGLYPWNMSGDKVLSSETSNFSNLFDKTVIFEFCDDEDVTNWHSVDPCTSGNEEALRSTVEAIKNISSTSLVRSDAGLAILYLSDEDEKNSKGITVNSDQVLAEIKNQLGSEKAVKAYAAIIQPGDATCLTSQTSIFSEPQASYGLAINDLVQKTGGKTVSICDSDYNSLFESVAQDFSGGGGSPLFTRVKLNHLPYSTESMRIKFTPNANVNWTLQGDEVIFLTAPPANTKIEISYEHKDN